MRLVPGGVRESGFRGVGYGEIRMTATAKRPTATPCPPYPLTSEPAVTRFLDDAKREITVMTDTDAETVTKCRAALAYWEHPGNKQDPDLAHWNAVHWTMKLAAVQARMERER